MEESSRAFPGTRGVAESMIWSVVDAMGTYTREMEVVGISLFAFKPRLTKRSGGAAG